MYSRLDFRSLVFTKALRETLELLTLLKNFFGTEIIVPEAPEIGGAFGAALILQETRWLKISFDELVSFTQYCFFTKLGK